MSCCTGHGIRIVGAMPESVAIVTTFSAGVCATCGALRRPRPLLEFFASPKALAAEERCVRRLDSQPKERLHA